jgi:hypothetical protein
MTEEEKEKEADRLANVLGSYGTVYDRYPHLRPKKKKRLTMDLSIKRRDYLLAKKSRRSNIFF